MYLILDNLRDYVFILLPFCVLLVLYKNAAGSFKNVYFTLGYVHQSSSELHNSKSI